MDCKEYLKRYRDLQLTIERLESRIAIEESRAEKVTTILSGMPRAGGESFADDTWAALADSKTTYKEKMLNALRVQKEIEEFIESVPGELNRLILQLRYVECLSWPEISDRIHYGLTRTHHLHGGALEEARRIYENRSV